jgi:two-component system, LytTR family, response regulator
MKTIRVLIVDDEAIARWGIRHLLAGETDVEILDDCANGLEAVAAIQERSPGVVFLDVQMPGLDGFGVLEAVGAERMPAVVFVTAYDQYAVRAFEVHALDYLLKPFDRERFLKAWQYARDRVHSETADELSQRLLALLKDRPQTPAYLERLVVKAAGRIFFLDVADVDWVEAADNYVQLHAGRETHLLRETISGLEARLDPKQFLRIRHSAIVNLKRVRELHPLFNGDYGVLLHNGTELVTSRRYRKRLRVLLGE